MEIQRYFGYGGVPMNKVPLPRAFGQVFEFMSFIMTGYCFGKGDYIMTGIFLLSGIILAFIVGQLMYMGFYDRIKKEVKELNGIQTEEGCETLKESH